MHTFSNTKIAVINETSGCKQCGACSCPKRARWQRTSANFSDQELAHRLEAALNSAWPPEEVSVSIEVFANQASGVFAVKVQGEGTSAQGIVAIDRSHSWYPDRVVALIVEGARCVMERLKNERRLPKISSALPGNC